MSPQPPNAPPPVRIEVPTDKVDNELDLHEILVAVARGADAASKQRGPNRPPAEAVKRLRALSDLANSAVTEFQQVKQVVPDIQTRFRIERPNR
jgi:hypothetical protein